jgi:hypothetical protein
VRRSFPQFGCYAHADRHGPAILRVPPCPSASPLSASAIDSHGVLFLCVFGLVCVLLIVLLAIAVDTGLVNI